MKTVLVTTLLLITFIAGYSIASGGQTQTGTISGIVQDSSGRTIPGVTVTAINASTGASVTVLTNESGTYRFVNQPFGTYSVSASLPGFAVQRATGITLGPNGPVQLNLTLSVAAGRFPSPQVRRDVEIQADRRTSQGAMTRYQGHVEMTTDNFIITADELDFNALTQHAELRGNVTVDVTSVAARGRLLGGGGIPQ
jgi:hypothetical protein